MSVQARNRQTASLRVSGWHRCRSEWRQMHTAIHLPRSIAGAQNRLLRRIRQELRTRIPDVVVGFQGGHLKLPAVLANNRIWFAHQSLENARIPRHWNALGSGPPALRRSNDITVEVNPAIHGVDRRVAGLFAVDDKTGHTALLHRGIIGGGTKGIGQTSFMEWYAGRRVKFFDPSRGDSKEQAILVADLGVEWVPRPARVICGRRAPL